MCSLKSSVIQKMFSSISADAKRKERNGYSFENFLEKADRLWRSRATLRGYEIRCVYGMRSPLPGAGISVVEYEATEYLEDDPTARRSSSIYQGRLKQIRKSRKLVQSWTTLPRAISWAIRVGTWIQRKLDTPSLITWDSAARTSGHISIWMPLMTSGSSTHRRESIEAVLDATVQNELRNPQDNVLAIIEEDYIRDPAALLIPWQHFSVMTR